MKKYPPISENKYLDAALQRELSSWKGKIVVLDDDPTGIQTVHGVSVYTAWNYEGIKTGFEENKSMFFILTNSRAMTSGESASIHRNIGKTLALISREIKKDFLLISRSDSTLRGHYPLETDILRETLEKETGFLFDGEIICPFFKEGGRFTFNDIHYVQNGNKLVPAALTEFAADKTFAYSHSDLKDWIAEKTAGEYPAKSVRSLPLEGIRAAVNRLESGISFSESFSSLSAVLNGVSGFGKIIVNAVDYPDIKAFCAALLCSITGGRRFIIRSAAAIPKILGGICDKPLLQRKDIIENETTQGLIVIGSHVEKTTRQLELLLQDKDIEAIEFNTHLVIDDVKFEAEQIRVQELCNKSLDSGKITVVFTRRDRFDLNTGNREDELYIAKKIAKAVTGFVSCLKFKPRFIIAKGGITSSEIGTDALRVKKALVLGQILPGVPVWLTGPESRFPCMPYIIFPGNVGSEDSLKQIVQMLK